jgi:hypothetical protein
VANCSIAPRESPNVEPTTVNTLSKVAGNLFAINEPWQHTFIPVGAVGAIPPLPLLRLLRPQLPFDRQR